MYHSDQVIWENICSGNVGSLRILHDRYYFQLCHFANRYLHDLSVSEELVSDCFWKLWSHKERIFIQKSVKAYLYFMVKNQLIDYSRKKQQDLIQVTEALPDFPDEEQMDKQDYYAYLYRAVNRLPEQRKKILEMAAFDGLSYKEIASRLDISVNTVKTQMGRAYRFLKEELDPRNLLLYVLFGQRD